MKQPISSQKATRQAAPTAHPDAAGSQGIALTPPSYGIDTIGHAPSEAMPNSGQLPTGTGPIQRQASIGGSDTGARPVNRTGLPNSLKTGIENISGMTMDDVRVHFNSSKPAQLQALAYTQGSQIHVAPGQERHLPHEAWHVVQQKQGRVRPTIQLKGTAINDDSGLEREADVMGGKGQHQQSNGVGRGALAHVVPSRTIMSDWPQGHQGQAPLTVQSSSRHPAIIQRVLRWKPDMLKSGSLQSIRDALKTYHDNVAQQNIDGQAKSLKDIENACTGILPKLTDPEDIKTIRQVLTDAIIQRFKITELETAISASKQQEAKQQEAKQQERNIGSRLVRKTNKVEDKPLNKVEDKPLNKYADNLIKEITKKGATPFVNLNKPESTGKGNGAINDVLKLKYKTGKDSTSSGYFKENIISHSDRFARAASMQGMNPDKSYALRAVAMSRLDELLGTNSVARTHFAEYNNTYGTFSEIAPGKQGAKLVPASPISSVAIKNLFTLQLLDAIAGQVDRHPGNYFINDGKKVTGIDLDYAFGSNSGEKFVMEGGAFSHYPGLPEYVDKEIADKIRNTKPEDIENTIEGLITTDELNKTIERFKFVQKSLDNMHIVKDQAGWKDLSEETKKDEKSYYRKLVNKIDNIDYKNISSRAMGLGWKVEFWDRNYTITIPNKETKEFDSQVDATKYLKFKLDERDKSLMKPFRSGW